MHIIRKEGTQRGAACLILPHLAHQPLATEHYQPLISPWAPKRLRKDCNAIGLQLKWAKVTERLERNRAQLKWAKVCFASTYLEHTFGLNQPNMSKIHELSELLRNFPVPLIIEEMGASPPHHHTIR